ncbi:MAG: hypothetical protein LBB72_03995 [Spirochaetaceae bacterium]|jgi:hypothetical protein|nr:hypothetical protein [Spirochaetaceae bacterium]
MKYAAGLFLAFLFCSCSALPSGKSWSTVSRTRRGTAELRTVRVDKIADWDSVEAEAGRLLPLLLAKRGYHYSDTDENQYLVDLVLIEREYMEKWKTRRCISAEVSISKPGRKTPLTAGKVICTGTKKSFSSSKVIHKLAKKALSGALRRLPRAIKRLPKQ